jgi:4-hydroxymandelate synthase
MTARTFDEMAVDHIEFYVADIRTGLQWLSGGLGLSVYAKGGKDARVGSVGVGGNQVRLVLTQPLVDDHPGSAYLERHGDGVADIALRVADASAAFTQAVRRGARPVAAPAERDGVVTATISGFGDVLHTFVERRPGVDERTLPGLRPGLAPADDPDGLLAVDHFAICLEAGTLADTVRFYEEVLDFELTFTERIVVGSQAIETQAVQSRCRNVTLTLIEPDVSQEPGQIDEFLKTHGGAGVQHIAFTTRDIVRAVDTLGHRGVEFLTTPDTYYSLLTDRLELTRHGIEDLRRLNVLVDEDHDGKLFQIFTRSVHPRNTLFLEVIERLGAQTFGSGNITALYQAVELQRANELQAAA